MVSQHYRIKAIKLRLRRQFEASLLPVFQSASLALPEPQVPPLVPSEAAQGVREAPAEPGAQAGLTPHLWGYRSNIELKAESPPSTGAEDGAVSGAGGVPLAGVDDGEVEGVEDGAPGVGCEDAGDAAPSPPEAGAVPPPSSGAKFGT